MQHIRNEARSETTLHKPKANFSRFTTVSKKKLFLYCLAISLLVLLLVLWIIFSGMKFHHRTESYKEVNGSAGFEASIGYDCGKQPCSYDFNVYILNEQGQQVSVLRPTKDGKVSAALAEGNYIMLIGKQFGKDTLFPQELLKLKNAQLLELKLQYKEAR